MDSLNAEAVAQALNAGCTRGTIDPELLRRRLDADASLAGLSETLPVSIPGRTH